MKMTYLPILLAMAVSGCIDASNGSSSGTGTTTPTTSFPLAQAIQTLQATGYPAVTGAAGGTATSGGIPEAVTGTYTVLDLAASAGATFGGAAALEQSASIQSIVGVSSPTTNLGNTYITYFTTTGTPLGQISTGEYCVISTSAPYPATVVVGDTGTVAIYNCYTDNTMTTPNGTSTTGYAISAAPATGSTSSTTTPTNVTYTAISAVLNAQSQLVAQYQVSYEMNTSGVLTFQSLAIKQNQGGVLYEVTSTTTAQ
jgi:hypothetical protein